MTLLVFGQTGQVARELQRHGNVRALSRDEADLRNPEACAEIISKSDARAVINAAAFTDVDGAETAALDADTINGRAPKAMAEAAAARGLPFIHISSDYVFDGSGSGAFKPEDETAPLGAYGRSKLAGETGVIDADGQAVVLRTSWVFSAHGKNFVKTMLRLGKTRTALNVVADQIGGPTPASDIAKAVLVIADKMCADSSLRGIFHFAGAPDVSWADFARTIFDKGGIAVTVHDIPSTDYPTPAHRPQNSRLDCSKTTKTFGLERPDWSAGLDAVLSELG